MTYRHRAPERLEADYESGRRTPPDEMAEELAPAVRELAEAVEADDTGTVPVEGRVSDYKSFLGALYAIEESGPDRSVVYLTPQRTNRASAIEKVESFGGEYIEHPGRHDLCIWEPWRESVGRVDDATCSANGCPFYLDSGEDAADRAAEALAVHVTRNGGVALDRDTFRDMGRRARQDACPAQLARKARSHPRTDGAVGSATYDKAFSEATAGGAPMSADVAVLDEAHSVAADPWATAERVEPGSLLSSIAVVVSYLSGHAERWAARVARDLEGLSESLDHWLERSQREHVDPGGVFDGATVDLGDCFASLDRLEGRLMQRVSSRAGESSWGAVAENMRPYNAAREVRAFLSRVASYREGDMDFVHDLYDEGGSEINDMAFRRVEPAPGGAATARDVYEEWLDRGTHPAIESRWGSVLDHYIESLWDGRHVASHGGPPGAPVTPMERLRETTGAETLVTLSATHNELSNPDRREGDARPTRHRLLTAPVYLRTSGSGREDYHGRRTASPSDPWFRRLFSMAAENTGDAVAAVPANFRNAEEWRGLPVERLEVDDPDADGGTREVVGVVPHSRGSIGSKGLEELDVDTVACGVQVQGPAPTARLVVGLWGMLAPRRDDPADALAESWRLLAQSAVAGTIQAGGRFGWGATNLVFERPGLLELAGYEHGRATPESPGFAGEFCRLFEGAAESYRDSRAALRAAKAVRYLRGQDRKAATLRQAVGQLRRAHGYDREEAERALWLAADRGRIEAPEEGGGELRPADGRRGERQGDQG